MAAPIHPLPVNQAQQDVHAVRGSKEYKAIWAKLDNVADHFSKIVAEPPFTSGAFAGYENIFNNATIVNYGKDDAKVDPRIELFSTVIKAKITLLRQNIELGRLRTDGLFEYDPRNWRQIGGDLKRLLAEEAPPSCCTIM